MNTNFNPFYTPLGKIRHVGDSSIEYHVYPNVQWVVKNYGTVEEKWYSQVVEKWAIKEFSLGEGSIQRFKNAMEDEIVAEQKRKQLYSEINKPLANVHKVDFPKSEAFTIYQHGYGITSAKSKMPILGSMDAGPCVILVLYDDKNKIAALAHIDTTTEVKSLAGIFKHFETESTIAYLYGGDQSSFNNCLDIIEFIKSSQIKIENCALIEHSNGDASLAIDARNGRLYSPVEPSDLTPCAYEKAHMNSIDYYIHQGRTPLKEEYNGLVD